MLRLAIFFFFLLPLLLAWPMEQKPLPSGAWERYALVPWNSPMQAAEEENPRGIQVRLRSLDGSNILTNLGADQSDTGNWMGSGNNGNSGWRRFNGDGVRRRGGLDSLGGGHILK